MLGALPWPVNEAADGEEGIRLARQAQPRLILLDLNMPGLGGIETLTRLKGDSRTSAIPVVIITSQTPTAQEREELMSGARAILSKEGLSPEALLEAMNDTL
jgi:CheY-like chemotaxis protein